MTARLILPSFARAALAAAALLAAPQLSAQDAGPSISEAVPVEATGAPDVLPSAALPPEALSDPPAAPAADADADRPEPVSTGALPFAAHFEAVIDPLGPGLDDVRLAIPETAVDLDTFEPPVEDDVLRDLGTGIASYYGRRFHGRRTANGERFNMRALTAAHRTLPFGSRVRVTNPRNGRSVTVRINDRGPFTRGRTIDLSRAAATRIGLVKRGHGRVELELVAP